MVFQMLFLLLLFVLISIPTVSKLWKKKQTRETAVYLSLMGLAAVIGVLSLTEIELPTPSDPLRSLFKPIGEMIFQTSDDNRMHQE